MRVSCERTCGAAPRRTGNYRPSGRALPRAPGSFVQLLGDLDAELLELAVKMRTLQADAVRHPAHVAAFSGDVMLEVHALEGVARFAQRQVERQSARGCARRLFERRHHP